MSEYPQLTVRLPAATKAKLNTLSLLTANPIWRIIDRAVDTYVQNLPEPERSRLGDIAERLVRGDWPVTSHWQAYGSITRAPQPLIQDERTERSPRTDSLRRASPRRTPRKGGKTL